MTNYYAYRNWLVKIEAPLFGTTKAFIFNLDTGDISAFQVQARDTHKYICEQIDLCYNEITDYHKGIPALIYLSGRESQMAKGVFEKYF